MYIHIETSQGLTPDLLRDIASQLETTGLESGKTPYPWKTIDKQNLNALSPDLKKSIESEIEDLEIALQNIKDHLDESFDN